MAKQLKKNREGDEVLMILPVSLLSSMYFISFLAERIERRDGQLLSLKRSIKKEMVSRFNDIATFTKIIYLLKFMR